MVGVVFQEVRRGSQHIGHPVRVFVGRRTYKDSLGPLRCHRMLYGILPYGLVSQRSNEEHKE